MSKKLTVISGGKQVAIKDLTRQQLAVLDRKSAYESMKESLNQIETYFDKKGIEKKPNRGGIMIFFNKKVKDTLGYSCDEIDSIKDVFLCNFVRNLRDEAVSVFDDYQNRWDKTHAQYEEMKATLWELPVIAKENYDHKMNRLGKLKHG